MDKRKILKLEKEAIELLLKSGFVKIKNRRYDYYKESRAGEVGITLRIDKIKRSWKMNIFGMFSDPVKAKSLGIDCNKFSGKYNFIDILSDRVVNNTLQLEYVINQYR